MHSLEEQEEFLNQLDLEPLYSKIREILGDKDLKFKKREIKQKRAGGLYIHFESENITNIGAFALIIKELVIEEFSCGIVDNEGSELGYWTMVNMSWKTKEGGFNGMNFLDAYYKDGNWEFLERYES